MLTSSFVEHTPTSGLSIVTLKVETWQLVQQQIGKLELTIYPKTQIKHLGIIFAILNRKKHLAAIANSTLKYD